MNKKLAIVILAMGILIPIKGQKHLFIQEKSLAILESNLNGWVIPVPSTLDYALKQFQDFAKDRLDVRMKKEEDLLYISEEVNVPRISSYRGDMIAYTFEASGHSDLALVYRLGYDISLNTQLWPAEMGNLRSVTKEFMAYLYSNFYTDSIAVVEKELKTFEKEKISLEKDLENNTDKIAKSKKNLSKEKDDVKIADLETEIKELTAANERIAQQLPDIKDGIGKLQMKITSLKHEMVEVQNAIGAV